MKRAGTSQCTLVEPRFLFGFWRIERPPEIPGSHGAIRSPLFADLRELLWRRQFFATEGLREAFLDSVVGYRPDVEPAELEEEQHLHRPAPDAAHLRDPLDDLFVGHAEEFPPAWH